jgi:hypothetical protein
MDPILFFYTDDVNKKTIELQRAGEDVLNLWVTVIGCRQLNKNARVFFFYLDFNRIFNNKQKWINKICVNQLCVEFDWASKYVKIMIYFLKPHEVTCSKRWLFLVF